MRTPVLGRNRGPAHRCSDRRAARAGLRRWFAEPLGRSLLEQERAQLARVLPGLFGYHVLQVGCPSDADLLGESRIRHRMVMDEDPADVGGCSVLAGSATALPVAGDSLDLLLLPHTLEFENSPHQVLREVERALIPEGHVIILAFNPWSMWGVQRLLARGRGSPWCGYFYSPTRLKDWLALLGFDTVAMRTFFFRPPMRRETMMAKTGFFERLGRRWWPLLGASYLLVAKKRVTTLTPIRPRWRPRRGLVGGRITEPTLHREETDGT